MKALISTLLFFLIFSTCAAQTQPSPEDCSILVIKNSWSKIRYRPDWDKPSMPDRYIDPRAPNSVSDPSKPNENLGTRRMDLSRSREVYILEATLKNTGSKTVVQVGWDYRFIESEGKLVTRHQFTNKVTIKQGRKKKVSAFMTKPPTRTVSVDKTIKEEVKINYVRYEDGTTWRSR